MRSQQTLPPAFPYHGCVGEKLQAGIRPGGADGGQFTFGASPTDYQKTIKNTATATITSAPASFTTGSVRSDIS